MFRTVLTTAALLFVPSLAAAECGPSLQAAGQRAAGAGGPASLTDLVSATYERAEAAESPQACVTAARALERLAALGGHVAPEGRRGEAFDAVMNEAAAAVAVAGETSSPAMEAPLAQAIDAAADMGLTLLAPQGSASTAAARLDAAQKAFAKAAADLRAAEGEIARAGGEPLAPLGRLQGYDKALQALIVASKARRDFTSSSFDDTAPPSRWAQIGLDDDWMRLPEAYRREWEELERQQRVATQQLDRVCDERYAKWTARYAANPTGGQDLNRDVLMPCQNENRAIVMAFEQKFYDLKAKHGLRTDQDIRDRVRDTEAQARRALEAAGMGPRQGSKAGPQTLDAVGPRQPRSPGERRYDLDLPDYAGPTDRPLTTPEGVHPPVPLPAGRP